MKYRKLGSVRLFKNPWQYLIFAWNFYWRRPIRLTLISATSSIFGLIVLHYSEGQNGSQKIFMQIIKVSLETFLKAILIRACWLELIEKKFTWSVCFVLNDKFFRFFTVTCFFEFVGYFGQKILMGQPTHPRPTELMFFWPSLRCFRWSHLYISLNYSSWTFIFCSRIRVSPILFDGAGKRLPESFGFYLSLCLPSCL